MFKRGPKNELEKIMDAILTIVEAATLVINKIQIHRENKKINQPLMGNKNEHECDTR